MEDGPTSITRCHRNEHRLTDAECGALAQGVRQTQSVAESKAIDTNHLPKIVVSASGMATGGRILHHLRIFAPDPRNTILFAGFQAGGTRGAAMIAGADTVKIFGDYIPVRAEVANLDMLSAHADQGELLDWLATCSGRPRQVYITHGEPAASDMLRRRIDERFGWPCLVPAYRDSFELG